MSIAEVIPFRAPDPQIEEVIVDTEDKNDGYTPLPNFICDEGYLVVLDGDAIKCLVFLNRHINGFHLQNKSISETLLKEKLGIKDGRTIQKHMSKLVQFQLVKILKENGKSNTYFLTFENRLPANNVGALGKKTEKLNTKPSTKYVGAFNKPPTKYVGEPPTNNVGTTTYKICGSVKEIYLKENIKKDEEEAQAKFQAQNRQLNFVQYHTDDRTQISFPELCKKYSAQIDFQDQARVSFPDHSPNRIFENLKKMAQWSLDKSNHTPQKWMTIWLDTFMKNLPSDSELAAAEARKQKSQSQTPKAEKQKRVSRFGRYLKPQQGEIYDV